MARVCCFALYLLVVAIANWPYVYINAYTVSFGAIDPLLNNSTQQQTFSRAGWPFDFYLSSTISTGQTATSFRWTGLLWSFVFWSMFPVLNAVARRLIGGAKTQLQECDEAVDDSRSLVMPSNEESIMKRTSGSFRMRLSEIFAFTALVAGILSYWLFLVRRGESDEKLASEIRQEGGFAIRTVMLPRIATSLLPYVGRRTFLRLSFVQLKNPTNELLKRVVELPYLSSLGLNGGDYSFRTLNQLSINPLFREVAIVRRLLDSEAISCIRSLPFIRKLNLMQTNITAEGLKAIGQPQLEELNLVQTNVRLSDLGRSAFAESLRVLRLPLPPNGTGDSLLLEGWPNLVELSCDDLDKPMNHEPVALTLRNLPKLETIELDVLQLFDIEVENAPKLRDVVPAFYRWQKRTTSSQIVPSSIWARRLRLSEVPELKELSFFPMNTESIEIDNAMMLVRLSTFNKTTYRIGEPPNHFTNRVGDTAPGFLNASDIPLETRQKWIDDLSSQCVIASLDLELVPLQDVKLAKLKENKSIRDLRVGMSGLTQSNFAEIEKMQQLEELSLVGINIDGLAIESLLRSLPKLRLLVCEPVGVKNIQIRNTSDLESLFVKPKRTSQDSLGENEMMGVMNSYASGPILADDLQLNLIPVESLQISNAPKLQDNFISKVPISQVHIEGAPSLKGLSFQEPLPSEAVIKDVRDLVFFAAGGPTCSDAIVNEVLNCKSLRSLTLAFTDLKPATLQRIADLVELESLTLTGSKIDNDFLASLSKLKNLRKLRLKQTSLENADLSALCNLKMLDILELGDWKIPPTAMEAIVTNNPLLTELSIVRAPLSSDSLRKIASLHELRKLDLSHCEIDDAMAEAFIERPAKKLEVLFLNSSTLSEQAFDLLRNELPKVQYRLQESFGFTFEIDPMRFSAK